MDYKHLLNSELNNKNKMETITLQVTDSQKKLITSLAKEFNIPVVKNKIIAELFKEA
jgi:hypothetical protein